MILKTKCQVCDVPMEVEYIPNEFLSADTCEKMATCDACLTQRFNEIVKPKLAFVEKVKLPYKDL